MMEKRKFPRVDLRRLSPDVHRVIGATVNWPNQITTEVLDVSHTGAALAAPKGLKISPGQELNLRFNIETLGSTPVECSVVRVGEHVIGVKFIAMDTTSRMNLEKFLESKLLGLNVRLVNPHYYGAKEDFSYWFHGPHDFNVFIWEKKQTPVRVLVEVDKHLLLYENELFSQGQKTDDPTDTEGEWTQTNIQTATPLMRKTLEILSQVQESKELLMPFIRILLERGS